MRQRGPRPTEGALHAAQRCLDHCVKNGIGDWDLAFAYEALARAHHVAGNEDEHLHYIARAREAGEAIADEEDRALLERDLAKLAAPSGSVRRQPGS